MTPEAEKGEENPGTQVPWLLVSGEGSVTGEDESIQNIVDPILKLEA